MNKNELYGPDAVLGKFLILMRACLEFVVLFFRYPSRQTLHFFKLVWKVTPSYSMVSVLRLKNLYDLGRRINETNIPGDIVECGVWNGGSSALIARASRESSTNGEQRAMWLFDSFEGLPEPGAEDPPDVHNNFIEGWCRGSTDRVRRIHRMLGNSLDHVNIVPGWFDDTLVSKESNIDQISLLHIDADWYDSVSLVLESFYHKVSPRGFVVLDDYGRWSSCKKAVHDFFDSQKLEGIEIIPVGKSAAYFTKPG